MTIPQRILVHVAIGAGLGIALATALTYAVVYRSVSEAELDHLDTYVAERARREEAGFRQVEANLALVRGQFLKRMESPLPRGIDSQWNARFEQFPDGAWRSKKEFSDGRKHSTLWAHKAVEFTPELKTQVLRAQNICDELLPGWVDVFPSVYFIMPGWLNIGFDPRIPNWVWDTPADYDPGPMEWFQLAMATNRAATDISWSGVIEEPTTKVPIVSVYLPMIREGRFLGSVGHDLFVNRLMEETTRSGFPGAGHVIFRNDGRLIAHAGKQREILGSGGRLRMQDCGDAALVSLFAVTRARPERRFSGFDEGSRCYYSVARLAGPEWLFLTTMPRDYLRQLAFRSAQWALWSGLASLALLLGFLAVTLRRQIAQPLAELTRATQQMSEGEATTRVDVDRRDELGALARAFNEMAGRVHERDAALRAEKASLERRVAERTAELARFASMAEASGDFFGFADLDERIVYVNPAGRRMLGLAADAPLDRLRIGDVHPDAAYTQLREALIPQALKDGSCAGETELRHLDGHEIPVSIMLAIPRAADGSPLFVSAIMHDITARRQAEARIAESERQLRDSEARFRTVFHNSPALQSLLRAEDSVLVEVNQTFLATLGFQRDEVIGRSPFELAAAEDPSALVAYREKLLAQGHIQHHELALRRCDGRRIRVLLSTYPVTINGTPHFVSAGVDITRQKEAEAELQHALATERELNQLRTQFVSLVSHEFRTPLEIIMSSADNLRRYHERLPPEKRERLLVTISRSVRRMSDMMEEVLVLGRLEANRMTFDPVPVDLPSLCRRICDEIDSATGARCVIELRTEGVPDMAHADESLLRHIFGNLLSNAVKYSPQQERVDFLVEREGADAVCRITDRGRGIPAADQKRLFQAFQRGGNVGQIPGTGLGLLIVQRCVALHGGGIQFESAEGQGTTFIVRLPLFPQDPSPT